MATGLLSVTAVCAQAPPYGEVPIVTGAASDDPLSLAALVRDGTTARAARVAAASRLLERVAQPDSRTVIFEILSEPWSDDCASRAMLTAIAGLPIGPRALQASVVKLAGGVDAASVPMVLGAISSFRSREAAKVLFEFSGPSSTPAVRAAAMLGLARLSGRDDLGTDRARWAEWLDVVQRMNEEEWQASLLSALAHKSDGQARTERELSSRLLESLRRLHLATPSEGRPSLVAGMLSDANDDVRTLGFELASRELSESRSLGPAVGDAVVSLLHNPAPEVRARAALLVSQVNPPAAADAIMAALRAETDARAASSLIQASIHWPSRDWLEPVLRWLESGTIAGGPAADAAWAMTRAGFVSDVSDRTRVLNAVRTLTPSQLTPAACQILAALGTKGDRDTLATYMKRDSTTLRTSAANALLLYREYLDAVFEAAAGEPQMFEFAVRGAVMYRSDRAGYFTIAALTAETPEAKRRALLTLAASLSADDLLAVLKSADGDQGFRESLLELFARPERILSERADPAKVSVIAEGVLMLAQSRIDMDRPDAALAALDVLPELPMLVDPERLSVLRATAVLCLNRTNDDLAQGAPCSVWLDALERVATKPFARGLADLAESKFQGSMNAEEAIRLAMIRARLPEPTPPDGASEFVGPLIPEGLRREK